jgi:prepilin-type N-terminal cleavage/methylation domain-containing protein
VKIRQVSRLAFTLVEMITAMAVLSLLLLIIFSIVGTTLKMTDMAGRGADSTIEAKQVLDRIGADISGMLVRPDIDQFYYKATGNDKMFFYSQPDGFFDPSVTTAGESPVVFIGYRINSTDNPLGMPTLERLAQGLVWDASVDKIVNTSTQIDANNTTLPLTYLTFPARTGVTNAMVATAGSITNTWGNDQGQQCPAVGSLAGNYDDGASPYYDSIGTQIFRFEICFQLQNGSFSLNPALTNCAPAYPASITNTVAVVVAIATLDNKSRKVVPSGSWSKLITALPDPTAQNLSTNCLMDTLWNNAINQQSFAATAGIPQTAASQVKVYQRYYYLNIPKAQ